MFQEGFLEEAAAKVAAATALLMVIVALDCVVTRAYGDADSRLHVIPLTRDAAASNPVLVLGFPCALLAAACFVKGRGAGAAAGRDASGTAAGGVGAVCSKKCGGGGGGGGGRQGGGGDCVSVCMHACSRQTHEGRSPLAP